MRVLIDTCVIMDAVQSREPFAQDAQTILLAAANQRIMGCVTAKEMTDIYYLAHRCTHDQGAARTIMGRLCSLLYILDTTESDIRRALASALSDYEDAVMVETALREEMDCIVTRNLSDYGASPVPAYSPHDFLIKLEQGWSQSDEN
jgi:predicted nucleic acid-binding protein